jgi:mitotic spindle assembly checkpoint protein MAD2B
MIEVYVNHLIYVRGLYPSAIFKDTKEYNIVVKVPIFDLVVNYIKTSMKTARELIATGELYCVEVQIYDDKRFYETHKITIGKSGSHSYNDEFLTEMESQIKNSLLALPNKTKSFKELPKSATFKILLHTTEEAYFKMQADPVFERLPFMQEFPESNEMPGKLVCVPVSRIATTNVNIIAEYNRTVKN